MSIIPNFSPIVNGPRYTNSQPPYPLFSNERKDDSIIIDKLNIKIISPPLTQSISGNVWIDTEQFYGNRAKFIVEFEGDVESLTIKREAKHNYPWLRPGSKTIYFKGKTSPLHVEYELDLDLGINYIPIIVKDKRGNTTSYSLKIEMSLVDEPSININNDIDIWN